MPTYQYACIACDHRFEAVQSFSDSALTDCPECSGTLRKLFSAVGIVFKGSGFYRNDSRSTSKSETPVESKKSDSVTSGASAEAGSSSSSAATGDSGGPPKTSTSAPSTSSGSGSGGSGSTATKAS